MMEYIDQGPEASWVKIGYDGKTGSVVLEVPGPPDRDFRLRVDPDVARAFARGLAHAAARLSTGASD